MDIRMIFIVILKDNACKTRLHYYFTACDILIDRVKWRSFKQIASAKSQTVRGASQQPFSMGTCLTISNTCFHCLPSWWVSPCVIKGSEDAALV